MSKDKGTKGYRDLDNLVTHLKEKEKHAHRIAYLKQMKQLKGGDANQAPEAKWRSEQPQLKGETK